MGKKSTKSIKITKITKPTKSTESTKLLEYAGNSLYRTDYSVLMDLEVQIGQNIPPILDTSRTPFGFVVEKGFIIQLGLANLKITKLPKSIGLLSKLEVLDLTNNQLETLPDSICELNTLKILILEENKLQNLPQKLGQLASLEKLYLFQNQISELPPSFNRLILLQEVSFHSNLLKLLPEDLGNLTALKKLGLGSNRLLEIPASIGKLLQLEYLSLEENMIHQLPQEIGELRNLQELNIFQNPLETVPSTLIKLTNLKKFKLWGTNIDAEKMKREMEPILESFRKQGCEIIAHGRDPYGTSPAIKQAIQNVKNKIIETDPQSLTSKSDAEITDQIERPSDPELEKYIFDELQDLLAMLAIGEEPARALALLQIEEKLRGNPIPNTILDILLSVYEADDSPRIRALAIRVLFHPPTPSWFFTREQREKIYRALQNNKKDGVEGDIAQEYLEIDDKLHFFSKKGAK